MRKKIIVGVWKDKLTVNQSSVLAKWLKQKTSGQDWPFIGGIAPAPIATVSVIKEFKDSQIRVVYQDVHWPAESGSYIGTTSLAMLKELNITMTIVGHSERRRFFSESDESIRRKVLGCCETGIFPIICIGDTEIDIEARRKVLREQLQNVIGRQLKPEIDLSKIAIAYEPVWAISTWRDKRPLPTGEEVAVMTDMVRTLIEEVTDRDPNNCSVLFGGSVSSSNAFDYFSQSTVDGALAGGASLTGESMYALYEAGIKAWQK